MISAGIKDDLLFNFGAFGQIEKEYRITITFVLKRFCV